MILDCMEIQAQRARQNLWNAHSRFRTANSPHLATRNFLDRDGMVGRLNLAILSGS